MKIGWAGYTWPFETASAALSIEPFLVTLSSVHPQSVGGSAAPPLMAHPDEHAQDAWLRENRII